MVRESYFLRVTGVTPHLLPAVTRDVTQENFIKKTVKTTVLPLLHPTADRDATNTPFRAFFLASHRVCLLSHEQTWKAGIVRWDTAEYKNPLQ